MASPHAAAVIKALGARKPGAVIARPGLSEDSIQMAVARHLDLLAMPGVVWWHTPNGGSRGRAEAGRFKLMGVKAGVPDLVLLRDAHLYGLELKTQAGRVSPDQAVLHVALRAAGATVAVAYGLDAALRQLEAWGLMKGKRHG